MEPSYKSQLPPMAVQMQPATDRRGLTGHGAVRKATVVAAWPAGVSALALAVTACQRRDFHLDWALRLANKNVPPSVFCD